MDEACSNSYKKRKNRDALEKIEFFKHALNVKDKEELLAVTNSLFLTTGSLVINFEKKFAAYMQSQYAVGVSSCTHALELCLRYFNIGVGDEVITTPLSFVATANAIEYVGAKPIFVDVESATGNLDVHLVEAAITPKTKAIIPVHLYGQMCDMQALRKLANTYNLKLIEDAAHCIEGMRNGIRVGALADAACYSFYATKNITSGEGGAVTTNSEEMALWLKKARSHGISSNAADRYTKKYQHYDMTFLGMKCNMTNLQAALLIHQVERIDLLHQRRKMLVELYDSLLKTIPKPDFLNDIKHAYHAYTIWSEKRDELMGYLQDYKIGVAVHYRPIHMMSYYQKKYGYQYCDFPIAYKMGAETLSLPLYPSLKDKNIEYVCDIIKSFS